MTRSFLAVATAVLFLQGCLRDKVTHSYTLLKPVYKAKEAVLSEINSQQPMPLVNPGKIYVYGNYLFVNEVNKGVHVIDNSNPSKPINKRFINIPGNVDIAIKGDALYADIFTDMVTLDISDPLVAKVTDIARDVFPERQYGNGFTADNSQYIVDWVVKDTTVNYEDNNFNRCGNCGIWLTFSAQASESKSQSVSKITTGIAGSMARFSIINNYLYTVNISQLFVFEISNQFQPERINQVSAGWNIETIYPFQDKLFLGSTTGMSIFDISNATTPTYVSAVSHLRMCDPVITDGKYAYITLRAGTDCGGTTNSQLQVLDVSNISNPVVLKTIEMSNPYGLGKLENLLWVCDGTAGIKVFDASDPATLKLKQTIDGLEAFDVIPADKNVIISAKVGIVQFDASNPDKIIELSRIQKQ
ncbi:MAG: hypothetical protein QM763_19210 [Agriterribacter sp.]